MLEPDGSISNRPTTILAADVRDTGDGRTLALANVIAGILGLATDDVFRRAERERRRKAKRRAVMLGAFAILFLSGLFAAGFAYVSVLREGFAKTSALERQARRVMDQGDPGSAISFLLESLVNIDGDVKKSAVSNRDIMRVLYEAYLLLPSYIELKGHQQPITAVAFSPDGASIATSSADGTVRIWGGVDGKQASMLDNHNMAITDVAFSPRGNALAASSEDGSISLWDYSNNLLLATLVGHKAPVEALSFNFDGSMLASVSNDGTVIIWNMDTNVAVGSLNIQDPSLKEAWTVSWNKDGTRLLTKGPRVQLWNTQTLSLPDPKGPFPEIGEIDNIALEASFSFDGSKVIIVGYDGSNVIDSSTGADISTLFGPQEPSISAAFQPSGSLIAIGFYDGSTWVEDSDQTKPASILGGHEGPVSKVRFSNNGSRLGTSSTDGSIIVYSNSLSSSPGLPRLVLRGHKTSVYDFQFNPSGTEIVSFAGNDSTPLLWKFDDFNNNLALRTAKLNKFDQTFNDSTGDFLAPIRELACIGGVGSCGGGGNALEDAVRTMQENMFLNISGSDVLISYLIELVPNCLGPQLRVTMGLDSAPPYWCIEKGKIPYNTVQWQSWLKSEQQGLSPDLPER